MEKFKFKSKEHQSNFHKLRSSLSIQNRFEKRILSLIYLIAADNSLSNQACDSLKDNDNLYDIFGSFLEDSQETFFNLGWSFLKGINNISIEQIANLSDEEYWLLINATKLFRVGLSKGYSEQHETLYLK